MTGNEPSSSLAYSTQAELKPSKAWLGLAHFHPQLRPFKGDELMLKPFKDNELMLRPFKGNELMPRPLKGDELKLF